MRTMQGEKGNRRQAGKERMGTGQIRMDGMEEQKGIDGMQERKRLDKKRKFCTG